VKVNIISVRKQPSGDIARMGRQDTFVTYGVEPGEIGTVTIPLDDPKPEDISKAIAAKLKERHPATGTTLEV